MTWQDALSIAEFLVVCGILYWEILTWKIEATNLKYARDYYKIRGEWFSARTKKRSAGGSNPGGAGADADGVGGSARPAGSEGEAGVEPAASETSSAERASNAAQDVSCG